MSRLAFSVVALGLLSASLAFSQTTSKSKEKARELLEKAIAAHGGAEVLEKLTTASWKGRGLLYKDGNDDKPLPFFGEWNGVLPTRYQYQYRFKAAGGTLVVTTGLLDGKAWRTLRANRGADDLPEKQLKAEMEEAHAHYVSRLVPLRSNDYLLTALPVAQRDSRFILGLKVDRKGYRSIYLFLDRQKSLLTWLDRKVFDADKNEEILQETSFLNFKTMGNAILPQSITIKRGKKLHMELEIESVTPKADIPNRIFEKPPEPKD